MKTFYENVFGLKLDFATDDSSYSQYGLLQTDLPMFDFEHISLIESDIPGSHYHGYILRFEADDLESIINNCAVNGGKVVRDPKKQDYGKTEMWLEDPEGNLIQVYKTT